MSRSEGPPQPLAVIQNEMQTTEGFLLDFVVSDFPFVSVLAQHLLKAGGKRLRVAMAWFGASYGSIGDNFDNVKMVAAAVELTHLATLHHDDVIDEAEARRGVPSVNANWTNTIAVLSGDYLLAKASELSSTVGGEVPLVLAQTISALCEGQVLEIESNHRVDRTVDQYLAVVERKTSWLLASSGYLGAVVGGASPDIAAKMRAFGTAFGNAFQVADDLLDYVGDSGETGKNLGTDLREGVYNLPLIHALSQTPSVATMIGREPDLDGVVGVMRDAGSFAYAFDVADRFAASAREILASLPQTPYTKGLEGLIEYVLHRARVVSAA